MAGSPGRFNDPHANLHPGPAEPYPVAPPAGRVTLPEYRAFFEVLSAESTEGTPVWRSALAGLVTLRYLDAWGEAATLGRTLGFERGAVGNAIRDLPGGAPERGLARGSHGGAIRGGRLRSHAGRLSASRLWPGASATRQLGDGRDVYARVYATSAPLVGQPVHRELAASAGTANGPVLSQGKRQCGGGRSISSCIGAWSHDWRRLYDLQGSARAGRRRPISATSHRRTNSWPPSSPTPLRMGPESARTRGMSEPRWRSAGVSRWKPSNTHRGVGGDSRSHGAGADPLGSGCNCRRERAVPTSRVRAGTAFRPAAEPVVRWLTIVRLMELAIQNRREIDFTRHRRALADVTLPPHVDAEYIYQGALGDLTFGREAQAVAALQALAEMAAEERLGDVLFRAEAALAAIARNASASASSLSPPSPPSRLADRLADRCGAGHARPTASMAC